MYIRKSSKYGKAIHIIHPGEFYLSDADIIIGTLLGSCVAVCLYDLESGIAGMNHFMLPGRISSTDIFSDKSARYGITAVHQLLDAIVKRGAKRKNIQSKIFGGGHVLNTGNEHASIPSDNIRLAKVMMEIEDIPIVTDDVGGIFTRKVLLDVKTGKVFLSKTTKEEVYSKISKRDSEFAERSFENGKSINN